VELTPIERPEFEYIAKNNALREGYIPPVQSTPYEICLGMSKEELKSLGVRYAIGAAHWRVDSPNAKDLPADLAIELKEWHRQQMFLACDERVTILGHPWWNARKLWYEDFSVIPRSMHEELASALKENGKYVECNRHFFMPYVASEKLSRQYAEFLREMFEKGVPVTYGSDSHGNYCDEREFTEKYLRLAGFKEGDLSEIAEKDLW
jgi:histidinol phosphatase-like PHP family hydrolase